MTDTEGAVDAPVATAAPVTKPSPKGRRRRISDRVPAEDQVTIEDLAQELGVSQMTVHRDLDTPEHQGRLLQAINEPAPPTDFDLVISDELLPQEEQDALQSLGVRYELAAEGSRRG
ncbi:hypothetical protein GCM10010211_42310 [Streptomyces albospinus]|uniref:HTH deoR-type domain-containing protein n=1 Tax=Streptomyces albospinus TaxID=285515 RepID=A0ABQ2V7N8_9ACTN|nr:DeoR family transcriptional regulator [Streptomyces albospinus]GGU72007.1 hypothetical protein GCM10010211_42310 [Streptomyces albospinus]